MTLAGQVVLLTGASGGIGRAVARALAAAGARVALLARDRVALDALSAELRDAALACPADVTREPEVQGAVRATQDRWGRLDALVYAAGIARYAPVGELGLGDWRATLDTNLTGAFLTLTACLPALTASGRGLALMVGSLASQHPYPESAAYAASKAGLLALADAAALDLREQGVRVCTVLPGSVATPITDPNEPSDWKLQPEDVAQVIVDLLALDPRVLPGHIELRPARVPAARRRGLTYQ